ncbi:MAG: PilN domain-containing protein [Phycisphaerales bacterium]|nr:PilN domain-containing protein [Phycisphaerales bacterium]
MSRLGNQEGRSGGVCAGVDERAGQVHVVIARLGEAWSIVEGRSLPIEDKASLENLLTQHHVTRVIRVAPATQSVCRVVSVPPGQPEQQASTLTLLAEAELPETVPSHRRAGGIVPDVVRGPERTAMLTGWLPASSSALLTAEIREDWATAPAALAMLKRDAALAAWADPTSGAMVVICAGPRRTICRTLREVADDRHAWRKALESAIEETAKAAEIRSEVEIADGLMLSDAAVRALAGEIKGFRSDPAWLEKYALALGAVLLGDERQAATATLAGLSVEPRVAPRAPGVRMIERLHDARVAMWVLAAALAGVLLIPMGAAYARLLLLDMRTQRLAGTQDKTEEITRTAKLYEELDKQRLPMTKLLADVAGAAPVGVVVENVRLSKEQGLSVLGTAETREKLNAFQANLNKTRVLSRATINRSEATSSGGVTFDMTAQITQPHLSVKPIEDLGGKSLAEVLYGEGATNDAFSGAVGGENGRRTGTRRPPSATGSSSGPTTSGDTSRRPTPVSTEPPSPLTDAAIAAMDRATLTKEFANRRTFGQRNPGLDQTTKQRLDDEVRKLRERMSAGGGS